MQQVKSGEVQSFIGVMRSFEGPDWGQYGEFSAVSERKDHDFLWRTRELSLQPARRTAEINQDKKNMSNRGQWKYPFSYAAETHKPSKNLGPDAYNRRCDSKRTLIVDK